MKTKLTQQQRQDNETTLRVESIKPQLFKGYRVVVGKNKGSGWFNYCIGNRTKALKVGMEMKKSEKLLFKRGLTKQKRTFMVLEPTILKKCDNSWCNKLCEQDENLCLSCEKIYCDIQNDIQIEARENAKVE
jgi:hypothetical protein